MKGPEPPREQPGQLGRTSALRGTAPYQDVGGKVLQQIKHQPCDEELQGEEAFWGQGRPMCLLCPLLASWRRGSLTSLLTYTGWM